MINSKKSRTTEQVLKAQLRKARATLKGERKLSNKLAKLQEKIEKTKKMTTAIRADRESRERIILSGKPDVPAASSPPLGFWDEGVAVEPRSFGNPIA